MIAASNETRHRLNVAARALLDVPRRQGDEPVDHPSSGAQIHWRQGVDAWTAVRKNVDALPIVVAMLCPETSEEVDAWAF